MKRFLLLFLALLVLIGLTACGGNVTDYGDDDSRTITDGAGRQVEVPENVGSVVCVGVGALRYTCYLQAQDLVVGVEDYEKSTDLTRLYNYVNSESFSQLPVIGTNGVPYEEEIINLGPQVIVMSRSATVDADELQRKTGIAVVVIPGSDTALDENCYETIRILGQLYGREDRADALTAYLKGIEEDLQNRMTSVTEHPSVYVGGVSYKGHHGFEGTESHYGPFALIGANNLADITGQSGAFNIDVEQVLSWDPEYIFLDYNGMNLIKEDYAKNPDYYNALTAVQEGKVYSQISFRSYACNLETALADAYFAATILYPEAFADVVIEEKVHEIFTMLLGSDPYPDLMEAGYAFTPLTLGS